MRKDLQAVVLLLLGVVLLRLTIGGQYVYYVKEGMKPFLLISAAVLLALAGWLLWSAVWRRSDDHDHPAPRVAWLLLAPVAVVYLVSPSALGSYTAARQLNNATTTTADQLPALPEVDPVDLPVADYITHAVWGGGRMLDGRTIRLTGFVTPDPAGGWWVTRLGMSCCAADALSFRVKAVDAADLPADTWVQVTGRWLPGGGTDSPQSIPNIRADEVIEIGEPANPYE